jgi:hypothetical protein
LSHKSTSFQRLPEKTQRRLRGLLDAYRPLAWRRSIEARKGKPLSDEHKAKLGASKRGRTQTRRKVSLWAIAEDALLGLPTTASAHKRGVWQGSIFQGRRRMGFPPGWAGAYMHGEVLAWRHFGDFCSDIGLSKKEAAPIVGLSYRGFTNRVRRKDNKPLSSRHPADKTIPHIGLRLAEAYGRLIERYCYVQGKRYRERNFLRSELRDLPAKHAALAKAFSALSQAFKSKEVPPEDDAILDWVCREAKRELAGQPTKASGSTFHTLLFFALPLQKLLKEKPELIRGLGNSPQSFNSRPSSLASTLLARDYGAAASRIDAAVAGEVEPLDSRVLRVAVLTTPPNPTVRSKRRGRHKQADETRRNFKIGLAVDTVIPIFQKLIATRRALPERVQRRRHLLRGELIQAGFSDQHVTAALISQTPTVAARRFISNTTGDLSFDVVAKYHRAYRRTRQS